MVGSTFFGIDVSQLATRLVAMRRKISKRVLLVEFRPDSLLLAEATLMQAGVKLSHISSFSLPPEALDRGVPAEPLKMADLLNDFCAAKKIPAHRVAVVLPPELAFHRLLDLPANLTTDEAREYVLNPVNGLQIPFPLTQTDFDLYPVSPPIEQQCPDESRLYMLTAIPQVLVDPIVEMLKAANLELQLLELGSHSQLRNHAAELITLAPQQVDLVLELLPDCSNLMLVSCSGLLGSERLAAIRNLPELDIEPDQVSIALETGLTAENILLKDDNYLPISDLDLRVLVADFRASVQRFHLKLPCAEIRRLILTGVNSSHSNLSNLFAEILGIPVVFFQPREATGLAELSMDDLLLQSSLSRLSGLALGLLPNEQYLSCSLDESRLNNQDSHQHNDAIAIADLLNSSGSQTGLDLPVLEPRSDGFVPDVSKGNDEQILDAESPVSLESNISSVVDSPIGSADQSIDLAAAPTAMNKDQGIISPLTILSSLDEEPLEITYKDCDSSCDQQSPLDFTFDADPPSAQEMADNAELFEEKWPTVQASSSGLGEQILSTANNDSLEFPNLNQTFPQSEISASPDVSLPETEWPTIASSKSIYQDLETDNDVEDHEIRRPSTGAEDQQDLIDSQGVIGNLEEPILIEEEFDLNSVDAAVSPGLSFDSEELIYAISEITPPSIDQEEELNVPRTESLDETVDNAENLNYDVSRRTDSPLSNESNSLGELRFAEDD